MKQIKQLILLALLTITFTKISAQWTPCKPCNPDPCLQGIITNYTNCEIFWDVLFPGNPQCSSNILFIAPPATIPATSLPYAITCHKCLDGPCSCPIGLKLLDPNDQTTPLSNFILSTYTPPTTVSNTYLTAADNCNPSITVKYIYLDGNIVNIEIRNP